MAVNKSLVFTITAKDGDVLKAFGRVGKAATKEMKAASDAMEDTRTAGQKMADALKAVADDLDTEFRGMESASSKLATSLGTDFDRGEAAVRGFVQDLRRSGLTFEEIEADADELALAIRKLDDIKLKKVAQGADDVATSVRKVGQEADNTQSVVANFAGNAASELPGISGALGPVNMAIGQFVEYATEGNIKLSSLAKAIGPMAAGAAMLVVINKAMDEMAADKAFKKEMVDGWANSIRNGERAIVRLREEIDATGKMMGRNLFGDQDDILPVIAAAGLKLSEFSAIVEGGTPKIQAWWAAIQQAGADSPAVTMAYATMLNSVADYEAGAKSAAVTSAFLGDQTTTAGGKIGAVADGFAAAIFGIGAAAAKGAEEVEASFRRIEAAFDRVRGKINEEQALDDLGESFEELEAAGVAAFDAMAKGAKDAEEKQDDYNDKLRATQLELLDVLQSYDNLPEELVTDVIAYVDQGKLSHAKAVLDALAHDRQVTYWATTRTRTGTTGGPREARAAGGPVSAGRMYEVNEEGPELLTTGGRQFLMMGQDSGHVTPISAPAVGYTGNAAGGGGTTVVLNMPNFIGTRDQVVDWMHEALLAKGRRNNGLGFT